MSKYSEALERYHKAKPFEIHQGFMGLSIVSDDEKEYETLKEAVEKAEKYDTVPECEKCAENGVCTVFERYVNLDTYKICQGYNLECAIRENQDLKEHKAEYEFWLNKLRKENEILREGIKAMFEHIDLVKNGGDIPYSLGRYIGSEKDSFLSDSETDKINAMLEVVENEKEN